MDLSMLADMSDAALLATFLVAAAILFLVEILTPTFGIATVLGVGAIFGAVFYGFKLHPAVGAAVVAGVVLLVPVYLWLTVKILPNTPIGRRMFLRAPQNVTGTGTPDAKELKPLQGKTGQAVTDLRPSGVVSVDGRRVDAVAEGKMIDKGDAIYVVRARGTDVVVRPAGTTAAGSA